MHSSQRTAIQIQENYFVNVSYTIMSTTINKIRVLRKYIFDKSSQMNQVFRYNSISMAFRYNLISIVFRYNSISIVFRYNSISIVFRYNSISIVFRYNSISIVFSQCIGDMQWLRSQCLGDV